MISLGKAFNLSLKRQIGSEDTAANHGAGYNGSGTIASFVKVV